MLGLTMTGNIDNSIEMQGNFSSESARAHVEDDNIGYVRPPSIPPPAPAFNLEPGLSDDGSWFGQIPPPGPDGKVEYAGSQLTTVRRSLRSSVPQARFLFNFSGSGAAQDLDTLLLPSIDWLDYSVAFAAEETRVDVAHHAVLSAAGDALTVVFDAPALATVFVEARCCTGGLQAAVVPAARGL